jgi:hypothetical protein
MADFELRNILMVMPVNPIIRCGIENQIIQYRCKSSLR